MAAKKPPTRYEAVGSANGDRPVTRLELLEGLVVGVARGFLWLVVAAAAAALLGGPAEPPTIRLEPAPDLPTLVIRVPGVVTVR